MCLLAHEVLAVLSYFFDKYERDRIPFCFLSYFFLGGGTMGALLACMLSIEDTVVDYSLQDYMFVVFHEKRTMHSLLLQAVALR